MKQGIKVIITLGDGPTLTPVLIWCEKRFGVKKVAWDWEFGISSKRQFNFYFNNATHATFFALRWA